LLYDRGRAKTMRTDFLWGWETGTWPKELKSLFPPRGSLEGNILKIVAIGTKLLKRG